MTVRGATLEEVSRLGPLPPAAVCRVGHKVAAALAAASGPDGAVSPRRIVVDETGGVTLVHDTAPQPERLLAPERRAGGPTSAGADVWSLGVILADAAFGRAVSTTPDGRLAEVVPGPSRFSDALAVLIAPENARLAKPAAAQRVFFELEPKLGGDGDALLGAAVRAFFETSSSPRTMELGRDGVVQLEELRRLARIAEDAAGRQAGAAAASVEPPMGMPSSVSSPPPGQKLADIEESGPLPAIPRFSRAAMIGIGVVAVILVFLAFVGGIIASK